ncbi:MAG TPA: hypothetical protein VGE41_01045 [Verrucomicrobiae bacterium]|jgi:hypothetical protein
MKMCVLIAGLVLLLAGTSVRAAEIEKPEYPNLEIQVTYMRPSEVKAFTSEMVQKAPGEQSSFRFGRKGGSVMLMWSFANRSEYGDVYKFSRILSVAEFGRENSQREVYFSGRETIIWQDEEIRITLKPKPANN